MKDNKLIAEFMGLKKCNCLNKPAPYYIPAKLWWIDEDDLYDEYGENNQMIDVHSLIVPNEMKFHTSWDWLMPVVEKITGLEEWHGEYCIDGAANTTFCHALLRANIGDVYEEVTDFIKWHNEQEV